MLTRQEQFEKIEEVFNDLGEWDKVAIHNRYCEDNNYVDDIIQYMNDLDDYCSGWSATEIIDHLDGMDTSDVFFVDGVWGMTSFDEYGCSSVEMQSDILDYMLDYDEDFGNDEIRECLDEINEEEEEEEE